MVARATLEQVCSSTAPNRERGQVTTTSLAKGDAKDDLKVANFIGVLN